MIFTSLSMMGQGWKVLEEDSRAFCRLVNSSDGKGEKVE
jgi:hypothetical protein